MTEPTEDEVGAEMSVDGFLSPLLDRFKSTITEAHAEWFDYARRLNRTVVTMWLGHPVQEPGQLPNDHEPLTIRLMARAMNGFEGAVLLLERGMTVEAGTIARSVYETGFWLAYLREHPVAARKYFLHEEILSKLGRNVAYEKMYSGDPEKLAVIRENLTDLRKRKAGSTLKKIQIEDVAKGGKSEAFFAYYKVLCGSSAHASVLSTDHYLQYFEDDTVGHTIGPDIEGTARKLAFACHALLLSALAFAAITEADACADLLTLTEEFYERSSRFKFGTLD